jgi:hypothetical protein
MYVPFLMKYMGVLMLAVFVMLDLIICFKRMCKIVSVCAEARTLLRNSKGIKWPK